MDIHSGGWKYFEEGQERAGEQKRVLHPRATKEKD